jgi:cell wall assembly regulator SMI1
MTNEAAGVVADCARIVAWLKTNAPSLVDRLCPPATSEALGFPFFEYSGLSAADIADERDCLEGLRKDGTFATHEIFENDGDFIQRVKWHEGWVPFCMDGCGNFFIIDLAPRPQGQSGQVLRWEVRGGAGATASVAFAEFMKRYADALTSGQFTLRVYSGTFDGPFVDLLA